MTLREAYFDGRQHAAIKHMFLRQYLPSLAFKTMQAPNIPHRHFIYVDGFTGPWEAKDKKFADTSFGIALTELNKVVYRLPGVSAECIFCEEQPSTFQQLQEHVANAKGKVEAKCFLGKFEDSIPSICKHVGKEGFLFAFIDPKGWKVGSEQITPLLIDRRSEVMFNFMSEFIRRFPNLKSVETAYGSLLADLDWRREFEILPPDMANDEKVLLLFRRLIRDKWRFDYIAELPVRKPRIDRIFYKLIYGTRSPHGVFAFRDAQAKAEKEGLAVAFEAEQVVQQSMFNADEDAELVTSAIGVGSRAHLLEASEETLRILAKANWKFIELAAVIMEVVPIQLTQMRKIVQELANKEQLFIRGSDLRGKPMNSSVISLRK